MSSRLLICSLWLATACIQSFGADLRPVSGADGIFETVRQNGKTAWRTARNGSGDYNRYLYFMVPTPPHPGATRYLEINYKDVGNGALGVEYNSEGLQNYRPASRSCEQLMRGTGEIRTAVFELAEVDFRHAQNLGADFRLIGPEISSPLVILSVRLLDRPPPVLLEKNAQPWLEPYKGPSRRDVDASSLQGKVVCGYQGWFRAPGDPTDEGWVHWSRDARQIAPETLTFDMWPDMTEYKKKYPAGPFKNRDGTQACLFSSADPETINLHFDWMRDYGIDGVFVQEFLGSLDRQDSTRVLGWVRQAANRTGRVFALEFDMSGYPPDKALPAMQKYWRRLVELKITSDPRYLHQNGKPVLAIFGFFADRFSGQAANQIIDAFKQPGETQVFLVGSGEWPWRAEKDPEWARAFRRFDAILPWNAGNTYSDGGVLHAQTNCWADDLAEAKRCHMLYIPELYPGFSWNNLKQTTDKPVGIPRRGGDFLREQFQTAKQLGIDTAFVGMFDEVDEGTAIFKVTDTPPTQGYFRTMEGKPSDFYLRLTGEGTRLLREKH